jgi:arylsulfatase A-like enzyme
MRLDSIREAPMSLTAEAGPVGIAPAAQDAHAPRRFRLSEILVLAVWFGLLAGLGELVCIGDAVYRRGQHLARLDESVRWTPDVLWMTPLADTLLLAAAGVLLAALAWPFPRLRSPRLVIFVYAALASLFLVYHFPLAGYARVLLALGLGATASRLAGNRPRLLGRLLKWTTGWARLPGAGRPSAVTGRGPDRGELEVNRRQVLVSSAATVAGLATGVQAVEWWRERRAFAALPPAESDRPNVLFLVLDTVRACSLGMNGYPCPTTPNLERIARDGITFRRAMAPSPWTLPSHATMFTGRMQHETGVNWDRPCANRYLTLAEFLRSHGYQTAGFVANTTFLSAAHGLHRGFAHYECHKKVSGEIIHSSGLATRMAYPALRRLGYYQLPGRKTAGELHRDLLDWLGNRDKKRPYFAFLNYFDAHSPYLPTPEAEGTFGARPPSSPFPGRGGAVLSREDIIELRDAYERCILGLDLEVGRLFERAGARRDLDNTLVIVTSDHGEHFGEHGLMDHGGDLYLPLLHVPLLILEPGRGRAGKVVAEPVSLRDLPATVVDLLGLGQQTPFPGRSLAALGEGRRPAGPEADLPILSELTRAPTFVGKGYPATKGPMRSLVWHDYHYIRNGNGTEELYQTADDPLEEKDIVGTAGARSVLARLRAFHDSESVS